MQVDLCAYAKVLEIDSRLHCDRGSGQQPADVMGLEVIQMHAVAVHLLTEAVSGPMKELVAVAGGGDVVPGDPVDLPALEGAAVRHRVSYELYRRVTAVSNDRERVGVAGGYRRPGESDPR